MGIDKDLSAQLAAQIQQVPKLQSVRIKSIKYYHISKSYWTCKKDNIKLWRYVEHVSWIFFSPKSALFGVWASQVPSSLVSVITIDQVVESVTWKLLLMLKVSRK